MCLNLTLLAFAITSEYKSLGTGTCYCSCWQCVSNQTLLWSCARICHPTWILASFIYTCHLRWTVSINSTFWFWFWSGCYNMICVIYYFSSYEALNNLQKRFPSLHKKYTYVLCIRCSHLQSKVDCTRISLGDFELSKMLQLHKGFVNIDVGIL